MKILTWILKKLNGMTTETIKGIIPKVGIFAFAGCSTHALSEFFQEMARTPSAWYDIASWLVEGFTAYVITLLVAQVKIALSSVSGKKGSTKERKRGGITFSICYTIIAAITITVSVIANTREFGGNVWLGLLFPALCVACAIAAGLDDVARAKRQEVQSKEEQPEKPPKPRKQLEFFAECKQCGWFGQNGGNEKRAYATARAAQCALNAHKCGGKNEC